MRLAIPTISKFLVATLIFCLWPIGRLHAEHPDLRSSKVIEITLRRGGGMSGKPTYSLTITGAGLVTYTGLAGVAIKGKRTRHISQASIAALNDEFVRANFFELQDSYISGVTDQPSCTLSLRADSYHKQIHHDDAGINKDPPEALIHLEYRIDEIAGSKRWVKGSFLHGFFHWK